MITKRINTVYIYNNPAKMYTRYFKQDNFTNRKTDFKSYFLMKN